MDLVILALGILSLFLKSKVFSIILTILTALIIIWANLVYLGLESEHKKNLLFNSLIIFTGVLCISIFGICKF